MWCLDFIFLTLFEVYSFIHSFQPRFINCLYHNMLALCELELGEGIINEARHHPRNLVPMVYRACDAEQQDCAIMAECWLSVSFSAPSHFPAMIFPLPTKQLYPISTLYMRELTLTGWVSKALGPAASSLVQPKGSSSGRQEVGGRQKLGYFFPSLSALCSMSSSDFGSHQRGPPELYLLYPNTEHHCLISFLSHAVSHNCLLLFSSTLPLCPLWKVSVLHTSTCLCNQFLRIKSLWYKYWEWFLCSSIDWRILEM